MSHLSISSRALYYVLEGEKVERGFTPPNVTDRSRHVQYISKHDASLSLVNVYVYSQPQTSCSHQKRKRQMSVYAISARPRRSTPARRHPRHTSTRIMIPTHQESQKWLHDSPGAASNGRWSAPTAAKSDASNTSCAAHQPRFSSPAARPWPPATPGSTPLINTKLARGG